jgi:hypothetical protein
LGKQTKLDFAEWCRGLGSGRSYVSDGYAHALEFNVGGQTPGNKDVHLDNPGEVMVTTKVAFAPETPETVAQGLLNPPAGKRMSGDTINLHAPRHRRFVKGGKRMVELIINGEVAFKKVLPADGVIHDLRFEVSIARSSWVALRHFPQLHTNPVNVIVAGKPIRASRASAQWCAESVKILWHNRHRFIKPAERLAAKAAYDRSIKLYERIAEECVAEPL